MITNVIYRLHQRKSIDSQKDASCLFYGNLKVNRGEIVDGH